jgi:hypothetical protein
MNDFNRSASLAALLALSLTPFFVTFGRLSEARAQTEVTAGPPPTEGTEASQTPETVVRKWPEGARATAREMIAKYGEPNRFSEGALVWIDNGPWQKTVVYRNAWPHFLGRRDKDYLEQTIAYRVPADKIEDLKRFDRRLEINESRGQLSSRSESEPMNFLALNLADEIVTDKRAVKDARDFMAKTESLARSGKTSPYTKGFLFPHRGASEDPRRTGSGPLEAPEP